MGKEKSYSICEEGNERMLSFKDGKIATRLAKFLRPCASSHSSAAAIPSTPLLHEIFTHCNQQWPPQVHFKTWHIPQKNWEAWLERLAGKYCAIWNNVGICDAVISSKHENRCNREIILGLVEYWCPETNTFVFPWGEVTVTLEDVMILGGFPVLGELVTRPLQGNLVKIEEEMNRKRLELSKGKSRKASHSVWLKYFMEKEDELEHVAFLSLWLSRYVFPSLPEKIVHRHVFPAAIHLSQGTRMALGPAVLASIYKNLTLLRKQAASSRKDVIASGPLQLVQLWAFERFPLLIGPKKSPNLLNPGEPRAARWHKISSRIDLPYVRSVLKLQENFMWRPYAEMRQLSFFNAAEWLVIDRKNLDDELRSYGRFLLASLLIGVNCEEKYCPHRVAMQFGLDQDLPGHFASINFAFENAKFYVPPGSFQPGTSARYHRWWNECKLTRRDKVKNTLRQARNQKSYRTSVSEQDLEAKLNKEENQASVVTETLEQSRTMPHASSTYTERRHSSVLDGFSSKTVMHISKRDKNQASLSSKISRNPRTMPEASTRFAERRHSSIPHGFSSNTKIHRSDKDKYRASISSSTLKEPRRMPEASVSYAERRRSSIHAFEKKSLKSSKKSPQVSTICRSQQSHAFASPESSRISNFVHLDQIPLAERLKHCTSATNRKASSQKGAFPHNRFQNFVSSRVRDGRNLKKRKLADTVDGILTSKRTANRADEEDNTTSAVIGLDRRVQMLEKIVGVSPEQQLTG